MNDSASERDDAAPAADVAADAPASPRRVLNPDLLWVESVTERLLGSSEPPTWERAPIGEQVTADARPTPDPASAPEAGRGTFEPAPEADEPDAPVAVVHQLPVRTPRPVTRPLSYAEVLADRPRIRLTEEPPPVPYFATTTEQQAGPAEPAVAPVPAKPRSAPGEDMPAGVLRAALRDALPDDTARRSGAVDAVFGDPSWRVAPEPEVAEPEAEDAAVDDVEFVDAALGHARAEAPPVDQPVAPLAPAPPVAEDEPLAPRAPVDLPPTVPLPPPPAAPAAPMPPQAAAPAAGGRHRTPDPGDAGTDVAAIRMALRSGDENLAAAVLALVADRGRERERVRMVEAYLDAVLAEGDDGLAGAARLRRLLGE